MADNNQDLEYISEDEQEQEQKQNGSNNVETQGPQQGYTTIHATSFKEFLLKPEIQRAIQEAGFEHPSAVQQECIQNAIMGNDLLCQAKSGMGKTAVFVLTILQGLDSTSKPASALVLCHTRELAYQIVQEFQRLGKFLPDVKSRVFYGGEPIEEQKRVLASKDAPQIIVGTPGRILDLVNKDYLKLDKLKYFVLDECDKMLEQLDMRKDVQQIFAKTPYNKQVMMYSATMSKDIKNVCKKFMQNQIEVSIDRDEKLTLDGLQQYYLEIREDQKNKKLFDLLDALVFNQVIIFVKSVQRAIALDQLLRKNSFPSIAIHSGLDQKERIKRYQQFKDFSERIMVSTDIFGRGIDVSRVNIVINYDMPAENAGTEKLSLTKDQAQELLTDSYLHRVGRAGRFGTKGLAISFVSSSDDKDVLEKIQRRFAVQIPELPDEIDTSQYMNN